MSCGDLGIMVLMGAAMGTCVFLCAEYPKRANFKPDPAWMAVCKIWGAVIFLVLAFSFFAWIISLFVN